jgi:hypothetical protein
MDRTQAIRLVGKLQALAADRAATEAETALARAKANALSARFRLGVAERARTRRQVRRRYRARRAWVASPQPDSSLDASTGIGSPNVGASDDWGDWKITVEIGWWTSGASWSAFTDRRSRVPRG